MDLEHGTTPIRIPQPQKAQWKDTTRSLIRCWSKPVWGPSWKPVSIHDCRASSTPSHSHSRASHLKMTAKNRQKSAEKSAAPSQEDAPKKTQKSSSSSSNGASGPAPQGPRTGGCLGLLVTVVFYVALLGAAGFVAFYLQQVVEQISQTNARHEESARQNAELSSKMESVVQQVGRNQ